MDNFDDIFLYIPSTGDIFIISEGDGCNLDTEDRENGYVDYVYYDIYGVCEDGLQEKDGGMIMCEQPVREKYNTLQDAVCDVLDMAYSYRDTAYVLLSEDPREDSGVLRELGAA